MDETAMVTEAEAETTVKGTTGAETMQTGDEGGGTENVGIAGRAGGEAVVMAMVIGMGIETIADGLRQANPRRVKQARARKGKKKWGDGAEDLVTMMAGAVDGTRAAREAVLRAGAGAGTGTAASPRATGQGTDERARARGPGLHPASLLPAVGASARMARRRDAVHLAPAPAASNPLPPRPFHMTRAEVRAKCIPRGEGECVA